MANPSRLNTEMLSIRSIGLKALALVWAAMTLISAVSAQAPEPRLLARHVPLAVAASRALHPLDRTRQLSLAIGLPLRNQAALDTFLQQVSDPTSPNYHHYLTPDQFTQQFGPTQADYDAVVHYAQERGLTVVHTHKNRMVVDVAGAAPQVERAFHVNLVTYANAARGEYYAPDREPSLDVNVTVQHITGLDNFSVPRPMDLKAASTTADPQTLTGSGPSGYLIGNDFRAAYAPGVPETGAGQTVALVEFDGFYAADVQKNFTKAGITPVPVQTVLLDGFNGAPGYANNEVTLDIMMSAYMAPGLTKIMSYEGYFPDDILNQIAVDNKARQISCSWTFGIDPTTEQIFKQFVAQGQTFLQAAGDSGAYKNGVDAPADDPNVTSVGGTHLTTAGASGPWSSETVWSYGGGGVSTTYPIPSYQQGIGASAGGYSTTMRNIPDVALTADVEIYLIYNNGAGGGIGGTSAAAPLWAGFVALANQRAAANGTPAVGFLNPAIYAIGSSGNYTSDFNDIKTGSNGYSAATGFDLSTGWGSPAGDHLIADLSHSAAQSFTISNTPNTVSMVPGGTASTNVAVAASGGFNSSVSFQVSGLPSGISASFASSSSTTGTSLTLTAASTVAAGTYTATVTGTSGTTSSTATLTITVTQPSFSISSSASGVSAQAGGTAASTTITVAGKNGFSGSVGLAATGLPSGMTASFSPASTSTTSVLTLTAGASTAAGTYTVSVAGTSGTLSSTTSLTISVSQPGFSLSSSAPSLGAQAGGTAASTTIAVTGTNGFSGAVGLTATGLPAGMTASFSPASTSTTSVLTLAAGAGTAAGTYTVGVTGTSGTLTSTTSLTISVTQPGFSLSSSAPSLAAQVGGSAASTTIAVSGTNGFSGLVGLTASGVPAGVTASFSPASTSTTSVLTLTASASAAAGTYTIGIAGVSGTLSATTSVVLTISSPAPSLSVWTADSSLTLLVGGARTPTTVYVSKPANISGNVNITLAGVPPGVTTGMNAPSTTTSTVLAFYPSASAVPGTYTVTVTGTLGTMKTSTGIQITIPQPSFSLASSISGVTLLVGGTGSNSIISIANPVGLSHAVNLTLSGVPAGLATYLVSPSTSTTCELDLRATTTAVPGTYTLTINGSTTGATASTTVQVIIPSPSFALSTESASLAKNAVGSSTSSLIKVVGQNGFKGTVNLAVSGVPAGMTASFGTPSTNSSSTLTFKQTGSIASGTYTVMVSGASGSLKASQAVQFTIP